MDSGQAAPGCDRRCSQHGQSPRAADTKQSLNEPPIARNHPGMARSPGSVSCCAGRFPPSGGCDERLCQDIEKATEENPDFRRVLLHRPALAVVVMSLGAGRGDWRGDPPRRDQFLPGREGRVGGSGSNEAMCTKLKSDDAVLVPPERGPTSSTAARGRSSCTRSTARRAP